MQASAAACSNAGLNPFAGQSTFDEHHASVTFTDPGTIGAQIADLNLQQVRVAWFETHHRTLPIGITADANYRWLSSCGVRSG